MVACLPAVFCDWQDDYRPSRYLLACSGGIDSMVLLDLLDKARPWLSAPLVVVYANHGWQTEAQKWGALVASRCAKSSIDCRFLSLSLAQVESNREASARTARYAAFAELLPSRGILLSAHHRDDQAETLLLNLLRGSGLAGLTAMPARKPFATGEHWRPLLGVSRAEISDYATRHRLDYGEDPSNRDTRYLRNWLRHEILPALSARIPDASAQIARSAHWLGEARQLENALLAEKLCIDDNQALLLSCLEKASPQLRAALVRTWLAGMNRPMPPYRRLQHWLVQLEGKANHAQLDYGGWHLLRHRDRILCITAGRPAAPPPVSEHSVWQGIGTLEICSGLDALPDELRWALYPPGGVFRPLDAPHHKPVKEWFRRAGIPPLLRRRTPLLVAGEEILWVGGIGPAARYPEMRIIWRCPGCSVSMNA